MSAWFAFSLLALLFAAAADAQQSGMKLGPTYVLRSAIDIMPNNTADRLLTDFSMMGGILSNVTHYEWESYDGWYNNPAHPEWGGAGKCDFCTFSLP